MAEGRILIQDRVMSHCVLCDCHVMQVLLVMQQVLPVIRLVLQNWLADPTVVEVCTCYTSIRDLTCHPNSPLI